MSKQKNFFLVIACIFYYKIFNNSAKATTDWGGYIVSDNLKDWYENTKLRQTFYTTLLSKLSIFYLSF